jgi:hypothetical protein
LIETLGKEGANKFFRNPFKGCDTLETQLLQGCDDFLNGPCSEGFKANPGLELANAFNVL